MQEERGDQPARDKAIENLALGWVTLIIVAMGVVGLVAGALGASEADRIVATISAGFVLLSACVWHGVIVAVQRLVPSGSR